MRISDWSSDVCSSDLVVVHLFDTIIHKLLHQGVLRKGLRRRHIDQARVIALIEMAVLRIHHSCLSIAHEVLAKFLVECVAVADGKGVVEGRRVSVRVELGGRGIIKTNNVVSWVPGLIYKH